MTDSNSKRIRHRRILKNYYKDVKFEGQINLDWNKIPEKRSRYTKTSVLEKYPKASRTAATTTVTVTAAATSTVAATTITAATSTEATTSTVTAAATTITSIEDAHLGKDEGVSGELVFETSVQDQLQLYAFTLISNKGFVYFDQQLTACALLDWNNDLKILKNDHPVLIYKVSGFGFVCTCNPERHDFINRVSSCVSNDIDNLYDRCLHIKALESISDSFLKYHGIEDAETHGSAKYSSGEDLINNFQTPWANDGKRNVKDMPV